MVKLVDTADLESVAYGVGVQVPLPAPKKTKLGNKMSKKLPVVKEVTDFNVEFADNGFVLNYSGQDENDDWTTSKMVIFDLDSLLSAIKYIVENKR